MKRFIESCLQSVTVFVLYACANNMILMLFLTSWLISVIYSKLLEGYLYIKEVLIARIIYFVGHLTINYCGNTH